MMSKDKSSSVDGKKADRVAQIKLAPAAKQDALLQANSQFKSQSFANHNDGGDFSAEDDKEIPAFNFKEALNPKEDLSEIMKAFDFYNDKKSDEGA